MIVRNLLGCLAVLAGLGLIVFGPVALDTALPDQRPVARSQPIALGALPVTVIPPSGALLDTTGSDPSHDSVQLVVGNVDYRLKAMRWSGSLEELAQMIRQGIRHHDGFQSMGYTRDALTDQLIAGRQTDWALTDQTGRTGVFLAEGIAVIVSFSENAQSLGPAAADIETSIASITIGEQR